MLEIEYREKLGEFELKKSTMEVEIRLSKGCRNTSSKNGNRYTFWSVEVT